MARNTLDLIYYGAIEAFSEKGYSASTMDYIAEKAGVVKGTLYYNFKSKDVLFIYVMKRGVERLTQITSGVLDAPMDQQSKWEGLIRAQLDFFEQNRSFFRLLMQTLWGPNLFEQITLQELLGDYFRRVDEELAEDQQQSRIDPDLDTQTISGALFGIVTIPAFRAVLNDQQINEEKRVKSINRIVLAIQNL